MSNKLTHWEPSVLTHGVDILYPNHNMNKAVSYPKDKVNDGAMDVITANTSGHNELPLQSTFTFTLLDTKKRGLAMVLHPGNSNPN